MKKKKKSKRLTIGDFDYLVAVGVVRAGSSADAIGVQPCRESRQRSYSRSTSVV